MSYLSCVFGRYERKIKNKAYKPFNKRNKKNIVFNKLPNKPFIRLSNWGGLDE